MGVFLRVNSVFWKDSPEVFLLEGKKMFSSFHPKVLAGVLCKRQVNKRKISLLASVTNGSIQR